MKPLFLLSRRYAGLFGVAAMVLCAVAGERAVADDFGIGRKVLTGRSFAVGSDLVPRMFHRASVMPNGRVLITGGIGVQPLPPALFSIDAISIYVVAQRTFAPLTSADGKPLKLITGRAHHTQTQLDDGRILITGGRTGAWERYDGRDSDTVEIISPAAGLVSAGPSMSEKRAYHSATKLADGRVLIAGGKSWQLFDPLTNQWGPAYSMQRRRNRHVALLLDETHLLLIGGLGTGGRTFELVDVQAKTSKRFRSQMREPINDLGAALLPDGRVLIVGGQKNFELETVNDCYLFDPSLDRLVRIDGPRNTPGGLSDFQIVQTHNHVVVIGGEAEKGRHDTELDLIAAFSIDWLEWSAIGKLRRPRDDAIGVLLSNGEFLVSGGAASAFQNPIPTASAEAIRFEDRLLGDINEDGRVTKVDLSELRAIVESVRHHTTGVRVVADVNRDGKLDDQDVVALQKAIKGRHVKDNGRVTDR